MLRFALMLSLAACSSGAAPSAEPTVKTAAAPAASIQTSASARCGLEAAVKSEDACSADAECGPSDPCHARACVAKAKAKPRGETTMCTEIMDCKSTDANDCRCFEGRCSLVPRH